MTNFMKKVISSFVLIFIYSAAFADGHVTTVKVGPCTVTIIAVDKYFRGTSPLISGSLDTEQSRNDVEKVKEALEKALLLSDDMENKTEDACSKQSNNIEIWVFRDSPFINYGQANSNAGRIKLDMGDIENIKQNLSGNQDAVNIVAEAKLTRIIAHEFDHLRHTDSTKHKDPPSEKADIETGPAVDDENLVISQMDFAYHRRNFYVAYTDGMAISSYAVDIDGDSIVDHWVTWFVPKETKITGGTSKYIFPEILYEVPTQWEPIIYSDSDLDGVPNGLDNCPELVNPQQGPDCN